MAVIDDQTTEKELDAMGRAGVCGIRLNLATAGVNDPDEARRKLRRAADRVEGRRWHVQVYTNAALIAAISEVVTAFPVPVVFDHFGGAQGNWGSIKPVFRNWCDCFGRGRHT